jgi:hypothetical protein
VTAASMINKRRDIPQRLARRQQESVPIVAELYDWVSEIKPNLVPKTPIYKACEYALEQREYFERCFTDGRFEIDNGEIERQFRVIKLGQKNFLFAGNDAGAERLAIAYTILANCTKHGVNPTEYLADVLDKIQNGWPNSRIDELLPHNWAASRASAS